ncbi:hypothetical protein TNCV_778151 [Trichonephila clavipes]|nr:hypothetical protein TNCV_778151 [Trichonephila clavipes]
MRWCRIIFNRSTSIANDGLRHSSWSNAVKCGRAYRRVERVNIQMQTGSHEGFFGDHGLKQARGSYPLSTQHWEWTPTIWSCIVTTYGKVLRIPNILLRRRHLSPRVGIAAASLVDFLTRHAWHTSREVEIMMMSDLTVATVR